MVSPKVIKTMVIAGKLVYLYAPGTRNRRTDHGPKPEELFPTEREKEIANRLEELSQEAFNAPLEPESEEPETDRERESAEPGATEDS